MEVRKGGQHQSRTADLGVVLRELFVAFVIAPAEKALGYTQDEPRAQKKRSGEGLAGPSSPLLPHFTHRSGLAPISLLPSKGR